LSRAFLIVAGLLTGTAAPTDIRGSWVLGKPYDLGQPVGLDQQQENEVVGTAIAISRDHIRVCGKQVPINTVALEHLTAAGFLARYNFRPNQLGFARGLISDVSINRYSSNNACGQFPDPGTHILLGGSHAVAEVGNDYFVLQRSR
jgi:hypothetical protein